MPTVLPQASGAGARAPAHWTALGPLNVFAIVAIFLGIGLARNPREVPLPMIDKPAPQFRLASVKGRALGLATDDLRGEVSVVNVFASWCGSCVPNA